MYKQALHLWWLGWIIGKILIVEYCKRKHGKRLPPEWLVSIELFANYFLFSD